LLEKKVRAVGLDAKCAKLIVFNVPQFLLFFSKYGLVHRVHHPQYGT
jgi:hypothetical protein